MLAKPDSMNPREIAESFVDENYRGCSFSMLFGSSLTDDMTEYSDIDVMVIYDEPVRSFREVKRWRGHLIDAWIYDVETLNGMIHMARRNRNQVILEIVLSAEAIPTPSAKFKLLQLAARRIREAGPLIEDIADYRHVLTGLIDDLRVARNQEEIASIAVELYSLIQNIILFMIGAGGFKKRHAVHSFRRHDPEFFCELGGALRSALFGESDKLINCSIGFLTQLGGELRENYKVAIPDSVRIPLPLV
jgi:predicted nucleotidyltransferase